MKNNKLADLRKELQSLADSQKAAGYLRFFKTAPGDYGHGIQFYGIRVPDQRKILKKYLELTLEEIRELLISDYHEERFIALQILVHQFKKADDPVREQIYKFYVKNMDLINNWDLVDTSAPQIVGAFLANKPRDLLYEYAKSSHLWKKRVSILATFYFIRKKDFKTTMEISEILLGDTHDLIHKAVGWMLREVANRDLALVKKFLDKHYHEMPRTMLRYAIEKFPEDLRKKYLVKQKT